MRLPDGQFPILRDRRDPGRASIPWRVIFPHELQAWKNHGQTLTWLAERGGLCPSEAIAVLEDRRWHSMDKDVANARLDELVALLEKNDA